LESTLSRPEPAVAEQAPKQDNSAVNPKRLAQQSRFWLKEAMAQRGGSEAFLRWLSSDVAKHA
jgi:beta-lactamase class D